MGVIDWWRVLVGEHLWQARWHSCRREEVAATVIAHERRELLRDTDGVLVEVAHHSVRVPSSQQFNCVVVRTANKQGHCATSPALSLCVGLMA